MCLPLQHSRVEFERDRFAQADAAKTGMRGIEEEILFGGNDRAWHCEDGTARRPQPPIADGCGFRARWRPAPIWRQFAELDCLHQAGVPFGAPGSTNVLRIAWVER